MNPPAIFLTGASAGIGWALAEALATPGTVLGLAARREDRLIALKARVEALGAVGHVFTVDVRNAAGMGEAVGEFAGRAGRLNMIIANAGISQPDGLGEGDASMANHVIEVNVQGVLNTLLPAIPLMRAAGCGHLVSIGSVAGFRGLPGKGAYCSSKAAVKMMMDAWRPMLKKDGIRVTTICPGWVESEMTKTNRYPMPFILPTEKAARLIVHALEQDRRTYIFPWQMRLIVPFMKLVPDWILANYFATR